MVCYDQTDLAKLPDGKLDFAVPPCLGRFRQDPPCVLLSPSQCTADRDSMYVIVIPDGKGTMSVAGFLSCSVLAVRSKVTTGDQPRGKGLFRPCGLTLVMRSSISLLLASSGNTNLYIPFGIGSYASAHAVDLILFAIKRSKACVQYRGRKTGPNLNKS